MRVTTFQLDGETVHAYWVSEFDLGNDEVATSGLAAGSDPDDVSEEETFALEQGEESDDSDDSGFWTGRLKSVQVFDKLKEDTSDERRDWRSMPDIVEVVGDSCYRNPKIKTFAYWQTAMKSERRTRIEHWQGSVSECTELDLESTGAGTDMPVDGGNMRKGRCYKEEKALTDSENALVEALFGWMEIVN